MATIIRRKKVYKKLNEDDANQAQNAQQPAGGAPQPGGAQPNAQQPANGQQQQNGQPAGGQQGGEQGPDMGECVKKINTFIVTLYTQLQTNIKENLTKQVPELDAVAKDGKSPYNAESKKVVEAYTKLTGIKVNPEDPKTLTEIMTSFGEFTTILSGFNKFVTDELAKQPQDNAQGGNAQNGQQPAAGGQQQQAGGQQPAGGAQPQNGQQPAGGQQATSESLIYDAFGQLLNDKLNESHIYNVLTDYFNLH